MEVRPHGRRIVPDGVGIVEPLREHDECLGQLGRFAGSDHASRLPAADDIDQVVHGDPLDAPIPPPFDGIFGDDPEPVETNGVTAVTNTVPADLSFFNAAVMPLLDTYCIDCHGEEKQKGDVRLDNQEALGGTNENDDPILTPGDPDNSGLYTTMLLPEDDDYHMPPPKKDQPKPEEIELIKWWIAAGADFEKTAEELNPPDAVKALTPSP